MKLGEILSIQIAPAAEAPLQNLQSVQAVAGMGLEGDRYFLRTGSFSKKHNESREITLIESEAIEALAREYSVGLSDLESRRNLTTRGAALNHLVGKEFRVGGAILRGIKLCEPCEHLEKVTGKPARAGLVHRGGLRAQIIASGTISVGDSIETM